MNGEVHVIPANVILMRLENHRKALEEKLANTPRWQILKRKTIQGGIAAYQYEIEKLLEITAKWQKFWNNIPEGPTKITKI